MSGRSRYRAQRIAALARMRLHTGHDPAPPGHLTAAQAAKRLQVSVRTIERYKRELRQSTGYPQK